ncbi:MAG TPA: hypothetical protein VJ839_00040 [Candidatus Limnocylindria bacterium]|nr:hypothetical protein [Candidatus Limnocylindria bacterium]
MRPVALAATVAGAHLATGWGVLQRRSWGRILGLVVNGTALAILILGVLGTMAWLPPSPTCGNSTASPNGSPTGSARS